MPVNYIKHVTLSRAGAPVDEDFDHVIASGDKIVAEIEYTSRPTATISIENSQMKIEPPTIAVDGAKTIVKKTIKVTLKDGVARGSSRRLAFKLGSSTRHKFLEVK